MSRVVVVNMRDPVTDEDGVVINTTSRSAADWSRGLSPFFLGPVRLYGDYISENVENGWQGSKVYPGYDDADGAPKESWFVWAKALWADKRAHRYPMGRGAKPLYSWWDGNRLTYIEARKKIYIPLYSSAVRDTPAFAKLKQLYENEPVIFLRDFDGYRHRDLKMAYEDVVNDPKRKCGHAFVLAMMLEGKV